MEAFVLVAIREAASQLTHASTSRCRSRACVHAGSRRHSALSLHQEQGNKQPFGAIGCLARGAAGLGDVRHCASPHPPF
ncbi:hypothetical protein XACJK48_3540011 [Xanthomonas citri pv. citri]|nr:hypothetical protein XAC1083_310027 [Xanthomonas citri pv. citri]CEE86238.1 hypothetical protein XACLE20_570025 [Xanthomonas citri pv. citri]CEH40285.1 hypothetical protein XACLE3_3410012 [Xanthomonas citri pv. citri]CEH40656.1 hypothetical protein XACJK48_3540011 [Xanthomonas citri pv. citri]CEI38223.1 hypothetical protein XACJJ10_870022 [Xanthomonas citri pv. citri]